MKHTLKELYKYYIPFYCGNKFEHFIYTSVTSRQSEYDNNNNNNNNKLFATCMCIYRPNIMQRTI